MFRQDNDAEKYLSMPIENVFFTDYLPTADGNKVKVYLYGLYRSRYPLPDLTLSEMAEILGMTLSEAEAALRYWERRGLVTQTRNDPPEYVFHSIAQRKQTKENTAIDAEYIEFSENVYSLFDARRKITPGEIAYAYEWIADLGLPAEVVLMLISHLISTRGINFSFKKGEELASLMRSENILTAEEAEQFFKEDNRIREGCRRLLRHMGKRRDATQDEIALYTKWLRNWGFTEEAITTACREMTKGDPSFAYLDAILLALYNGNTVAPGQIDKKIANDKQKKDAMRSVLNTLGLSLSLRAFESIYDSWLQIYPLPVILLAAKECSLLQSGKAEKTGDMLESWKNRRALKNETEVQAYLDACHSQNRILKDLFEKMGYAGTVTEKDRELLKKWQGLGFNDELLAYAAELSRQATGRKLQYMDSILTQWCMAGITDISQAKADSGKKKSPAGTPEKKLNAQNYTQREYTREEMDQLQKRMMEEALSNDD